jgi:hypothetical protein
VSKKHVTQIISLLSEKKQSKDSMKTVLANCNIFDAYLYKHLTKCNIVRYMYWCAHVQDLDFSGVEWLCDFQKLAQVNKWTEDDLYSAGQSLLFQPSDDDDESSEDDEEEDCSAYENTDASNSEYESGMDTDYQTSVDSDEEYEHDDDKSTKKKKNKSFPRLTNEQIKLILGNEINLTERGQEAMETVTMNIVQKIGDNHKLIDKLSRQYNNSSLKGLVKTASCDMQYSVFLLQSLRFLILKSAFDYCAEKEYSQVRKSTIEIVTSRGELAETIEILEKT